jgi:hypothetical protein
VAGCFAPFLRARAGTIEVLLAAVTDGWRINVIGRGAVFSGEAGRVRVLWQAPAD